MHTHHLSGLILALLLGVSTPVLAGPTEDLVTAVQRHEVKIVKKALANGLSVKDPDKQGNTPFLELFPEENGWSIDENQPELKEISQLMLAKGATMPAVTMRVLVETENTVWLDWVIKNHCPGDDMLIKGDESALVHSLVDQGTRLKEQVYTNECDNKIIYG